MRQLNIKLVCESKWEESVEKEETERWPRATSVVKIKSHRAVGLGSGRDAWRDTGRSSVDVKK